MYQIIKVLNNNALLVQRKNRETESILLGKGIGFGRRNGDILSGRQEAKEYTLEASDGRSITIGTENGIEAIYLEAAGRIIEEAEIVFEGINSDILLPLADHIAFAARRQREKIYIPNPFIPDIKVLFGKEYAVALKSREIIRELAGYEISDDEAGFIALHIHSGLSDEQVSDTMKATQTIDSSMQLLNRLANKTFDVNSLTYTRLLSHLYYMIMRTRTGETVNIDLNGFMTQTYPDAVNIAEQICEYMETQLGSKLDEHEMGYLAVHIQRLLAE